MSTDGQKPKYSDCLSISNSMWPIVGLDPNLNYEKAVYNSLNCGIAIYMYYCTQCFEKYTPHSIHEFQTSFSLHCLFSL
jgi:hypothetical protein